MHSTRTPIKVIFETTEAKKYFLKNLLKFPFESGFFPLFIFWLIDLNDH